MDGRKRRKSPQQIFSTSALHACVSVCKPFPFSPLILPRRRNELRSEILYTQRFPLLTFFLFISTLALAL